MAQTVDTRSLDNLLKSWDTLTSRFPNVKQSLLMELGREMLQRVRQQAGGTGKVARWQDLHVGSGGGYAAVRAKRDIYQATKSGKRYSVGHITNAIEGGHKIPSRRGGKNYRPEIYVAAVPGKWFYDKVRRELPGMGEQETRRLAQMIADGLEGRL